MKLVEILKLAAFSIVGITIALMLRDGIYLLARKFWKHILVPIWKIAGPKPGGKLWAATRMLGSK